MKNVIVGTAGHVDHGKTCLIKALAGTDTDRLKEEKARGITIENGFAELIQDDYNISIIDVPGHEKFVKNMLAGIGGIDLVLLVIGLDEGVMPQTVEHFEILKMLHIKDGIIVLTKDDLVEDEDWKELVEEDAKDLVAGTFMENAPVIRVSAVTGFNIEELRKLLARRLEAIGEREIDEEMFRLPIDRVFTIDGFGTVITGTLLEGSVRPGDTVRVYPKGDPLKIRNVQVHNETVEVAYAGQRTALNLAGVKKEDLNRGDVLSAEGCLETSQMLDVEIEIFNNTERALLTGSRVHFYCGSSQALCKVVLLDAEVLEKGERGFAQLRLEEDIAVKKGDRFIIRFYSPVESIGGGVVLDANPRKHKAFKEPVLESLQIKSKGSLKEIVELTVKELSGEMADIGRISRKLSITRQNCQQIVDELCDEKKVEKLVGTVYIHSEYTEFLQRMAEEILTLYHKENALSTGMGKEEFKSRLGQVLRLENGKLLEAVAVLLAEKSVISASDNKVRLWDFKVSYSPEMESMRRRILERYQSKGFEMPTVDEVLDREKDKKNARHVIDALAEEGSLVKVNFKYYILAERYEEAKNIIRSKVSDNGSMTLAEFRDSIGTSRKYAVELLEHFDEIKFTKKTDDSRVLA